MEMDFGQAVERMRGIGYPSVSNRVFIKIPNAEPLLKRGLNYFTQGQAVWCEQNYRPIVDWMTDNKGRGLLLAGGCGLGKSLIGMRILPLVINHVCQRIVYCFKAQDMSTKPDEVMSHHLVYIDDVGTESVSIIYGNKRVPFAELCDMAEQKGKLLILSTNCDIAHLTEKYGERTVDRLRAITKYVPLTGISLRQ